MSTIFDLFAQQLNEATQVFASRLDAYLQALGGIGLQDVPLNRRLDMNAIRYELTLQYASGGPQTFRAAYFSTVLSSVPVDTQFSTFFAGLPSSRAAFILDVSQERRRALDHDAVLVIYTSNLVPNCGQDRSRPVIVQALGNIAAGASGNVQLVSSTGLITGTFAAVNRSGAVWAAGTRGYAAVRPGTCIWDGYPTCC